MTLPPDVDVRVMLPCAGYGEPDQASVLDAPPTRFQPLRRVARNTGRLKEAVDRAVAGRLLAWCLSLMTFRRGWSVWSLRPELGGCDARCDSQGRPARPPVHAGRADRQAQGGNLVGSQGRANAAARWRQRRWAGLDGWLLAALAGSHVHHASALTCRAALPELDGGLRTCGSNQRLRRPWFFRLPVQRSRRR